MGHSSNLGLLKFWGKDMRHKSNYISVENSGAGGEKIKSLEHRGHRGAQRKSTAKAKGSTEEATARAKESTGESTPRAKASGPVDLGRLTAGGGCPYMSWGGLNNFQTVWRV